MGGHEFRLKVTFERDSPCAAAVSLFLPLVFLSPPFPPPSTTTQPARSTHVPHTDRHTPNHLPRTHDTHNKQFTAHFHWRDHRTHHTQPPTRSDNASLPSSVTTPQTARSLVLSFLHMRLSDSAGRVHDDADASLNARQPVRKMKGGGRSGGGFFHRGLALQCIYRPTGLLFPQH